MSTFLRINESKSNDLNLEFIVSVETDLNPDDSPASKCSPKRDNWIVWDLDNETSGPASPVSAAGGVKSESTAV